MTKLWTISRVRFTSGDYISMANLSLRYSSPRALESLVQCHDAAKCHGWKTDNGMVCQSFSFTHMECDRAAPLMLMGRTLPCFSYVGPRWALCYCRQGDQSAILWNISGTNCALVLIPFNKWWSIGSLGVWFWLFWLVNWSNTLWLVNHF